MWPDLKNCPPSLRAWHSYNPSSLRCKPLMINSETFQLKEKNRPIVLFCNLFFMTSVVWQYFFSNLICFDEFELALGSRLSLCVHIIRFGFGVKFKLLYCYNQINTRQVNIFSNFEIFLLVLQSKAKTISCLQILQSVWINIVLDWKFWRKYRSVSYLFTCKKVNIEDFLLTKSVERTFKCVT